MTKATTDKFIFASPFRCIILFVKNNPRNWKQKNNFNLISWSKNYINDICIELGKSWKLRFPFKLYLIKYENSPGLETGDLLISWKSPCKTTLSDHSWKLLNQTRNMLYEGWCLVSRNRICLVSLLVILFVSFNKWQIFYLFSKEHRDYKTNNRNIYLASICSLQWQIFLSLNKYIK